MEVFKMINYYKSNKKYMSKSDAIKKASTIILKLIALIDMRGKYNRREVKKILKNKDF